MKQPKVSIIVPCYGVEKYLNRCMESLVNQKLKDIEIILVDDQSPDKVPAICDSWAKQDNRITVIHKTQNEGLGYARNSGLDIARGEYVAFVDSDDYVDLEMYEILYTEASKNNIDAVFSCFRREHLSGIWVDSNEVQKRTEWKTPKDIRAFLLDIIAYPPFVKRERGYTMSVWRSIYKRSIIEDNGIRFLSERDIVSEDIPFQCDFLGKSQKVVFLPNNFYYYCLNGTSLTATYKSEKFDRYKKLHSVLLEKLGNDKEVKERLYRFYLGNTRNLILQLMNSNVSDKKVQMKKVMADSFWKEISKDFSPNYLPIYPRLFYYFILNKQYLFLSILCIFVKFLKSHRASPTL